MMARIPQIPTNHADPTGLDPAERAAIAEFRRRFNEIARRVIAIVDTLTYSVITVNASRYVYDLQPATVAYVISNINDVIDDVLDEDSTDDTTWFFESYVKPAYVKGTAQAFSNMSKQSPVYKAGARSVRDIVQSDPYRRRIALVQAREFELMKGVIGDTKSGLARVLTDGLARGNGPREVAKAIRTETGMSIARSERIARTELTTALKRARLDESDEATEKYGVEFKQMHMSALSPTTRRSHAARSGNLYTSAEVREWYSHSGNAINCKCTQIEVMVGDDGRPLVPTIGARLKAARERYEADNNIDLSKE